MTRNLSFSENDIALYECPISCGWTSRQLLLRAAVHYAGLRRIKSLDFSIETGVHGKPFFPHMPEARFSISHSGEFWACAFHGRELGLDLQEHRDCDYLPIARRFFHPEEYGTVLNGGKSAKELFFDIWSAKESYIKYTSRGLSQPMREFSTLDGFAGEGLSLIPLSFGPQYSAFICALSPQRIYRLLRF